VIVGKRTPGASAFELATNTKRVSRFTFPDGRVASVKVYLDGQGSGAAGSPALLRPVIYRAADNSLVAVGDELSLPSGSAAAWRDLTFVGAAPGGALLAAGDYDMGVIAGGASLTARVFQTVPDGAGGRWNADTYPDPSDPFGGATALTGRFAIVAQPFRAWAAPDELEVWYARMPHDEAQAVFAATGTQAGPKLASCSWHGTGLDPERGSFVVVRAGGRLDPWVGERVKITSRESGTHRGDAVYGFVHNALDIDDDLSVTRRMFLALALPGLDRIEVAVELMR
jgi:hypothetical protein